MATRRAPKTAAKTEARATRKTARARAATRPRDAGATRDRLLRAGLALFAERGFEGATVDQIARRARANKAMVSYHFGGKLGLYRAIFGTFLERAVDALAASAATEATAAERLRAFIGAWGGFAIEEPAFPILVSRETLAAGRHLGDGELPKFLAVFGAVRELFAQGEADGTLHTDAPFLTHLALIGSLIFFFATEPFRQMVFRRMTLPVAKPGLAEYVHHLQDLYVRALAPAAPAAAPSRRGRGDTR